MKGKRIETAAQRRPDNENIINVTIDLLMKSKANNFALYVLLVMHAHGRTLEELAYLWIILLHTPHIENPF